MKLFYTLCFLLWISRINGQVNFSWNGSIDSDWDNALNWTPNGIPSSSDNVSIFSAPNFVFLNSSKNISNFTLSSGFINLNGFFLRPTGNTLFSSGSVSNGTVDIVAGVLNITQLVNPIFNADAALSVNTGSITLTSGVYNGAVNMQTSYMPSASSATFNSSFSFTSTGSGSALTISGIFNGPSIVTATSSSSIAIYNVGIFNNGLVLNNYSSGAINLYNAGPGTFPSNLTINSLSAGPINIGGGGTVDFFGNIYVNSNSSGTIRFGAGSTTSPVILNPGYTISVGSSGFTSGSLLFPHFKQLGASTPINLNLTGTTSLVSFGNSVTNTEFNSDLVVSSPKITIAYSKFYGSANFTKISGAASADLSAGGNLFNSTAFFINNSTFNFGLATGASLSDTYNGDVSFFQNSTGTIQPNRSSNCFYNGNINISSPLSTPIIFGGNNGIAIISGIVNQSISKTASSAFPTFRRITINKPSGSVMLNTRINITGTLTLSNGIVHSSTTNIINMINNSLVTDIGNSSSFINGPMNYEAAGGTKTLIFPIGKGADWRPFKLDISQAFLITTHTYKAEMFNSNAQALNWTLPVTVDNVSPTRYYTIDRFVTSTGISSPSVQLNSNPVITFYYDSSDGVLDPVNLTLCKNTINSPTSWVDIGGAGATVTTGSVASTSSPSAFDSFGSTFAFANKIGGANPLPIELIGFKAEVIDNSYVFLSWETLSESNNDRFEIEKSIDGVNFEVIDVIYSKAINGNSISKLSYNSIDNFTEKGLLYYRLRQIDKGNINGVYSSIISVEVSDNKHSTVFLVSPNPNSGDFNIQVNVRGIYTIVNSIGQTVETIEIKDDSQKVAVNGLSPGIYYLIGKNSKTKIVVTK